MDTYLSKSDDGELVIELPPRITLEICGKQITFNPRADDFDMRVREIVARLKAWQTLCASETCVVDLSLAPGLQQGLNSTSR